jgi:hypothetical protein
MSVETLTSHERSASAGRVASAWVREACNHPNLLVLPFHVELIRAAA